MSGLDVPEIKSAYEDVRSDTSETNWLLISYAAASGDKCKPNFSLCPPPSPFIFIADLPPPPTVTLASTGTGGLTELQSALDPSQAQYAYARIEYANDTESKRVKFVLIIWIGEGTKVMRKARVSFESAAVKKVLGHHSIQVDARDKGDLNEKEIVARLRAAGGADYNGGRG